MKQKESLFKHFMSVEVLGLQKDSANVACMPCQSNDTCTPC